MSNFCMGCQGECSCTKETAIIVDLDGTLCNADHRLHLIQKEPKDFKTFFSLAHLDGVNEWCRSIVIGAQASGQRILFVTGRGAGEFELTAKWILDNVGILAKLNENIFMRATGDKRSDTEIKLELYRNAIEPNYKVLFAIDDRKAVIDLWRSLGITALHCSDWEEKSGSIEKEVRQHFRSTEQEGAGVTVASKRCACGKTATHFLGVEDDTSPIDWEFNYCDECNLRRQK